MNPNKNIGEQPQPLSEAKLDELNKQLNGYKQVNEHLENFLDFPLPDQTKEK